MPTSVIEKLKEEGYTEELDIGGEGYWEIRRLGEVDQAKPLTEKGASFTAQHILPDR